MLHSARRHWKVVSEGVRGAAGKGESEDQREFWLPSHRLATGPGHVFYDKLNRLLAENGFDLFVEQLCQPHYKTGGRPSIPPGVYFRMRMIGYTLGY